jgi:hypothetical protein
MALESVVMDSFMASRTKVQLIEGGYAMLHKIAIAAVIIAVLGCASDARALSERIGLAEIAGAHLAGPAALGGNSDDHHRVFQRFQSGSAHVDLGVKGYGCISHPDYGLYTPHFC